MKLWGSEPNSTLLRERRTKDTSYVSSSDKTVFFFLEERSGVVENGKVPDT